MVGGRGNSAPTFMRGWLVNDRLTAIPGTRTLWNHLLTEVPELVDKTTGTYAGLAESIEFDAAREAPDYIIRNAAYFRWLDVPCPVISFVQDVLEGSPRTLLIGACEASRLVVFNSEYTRAAYPELHAADYRIIPIGTDERLFVERDVDKDGSVLWVGSGHSVKGFNLACQLAIESARPWVFVLKDDAKVPPIGTVYRRIPQWRLAELASAAAVGVCTSREETQHLAGIEMGMCGLPLVATPVGVYHERPMGAWGMQSDGDWHSCIALAARLERKAAAAYWRDEGFGLANCMSMWKTTIKSLEAAHVG